LVVESLVEVVGFLVVVVDIFVVMGLVVVITGFLDVVCGFVVIFFVVVSENVEEVEDCLVESVEAFVVLEVAGWNVVFIDGVVDI
jgi:hypothetical protein